MLQKIESSLSAGLMTLSFLGKINKSIWLNWGGLMTYMRIISSQILSLMCKLGLIGQVYFLQEESVKSTCFKAINKAE